MSGIDESIAHMIDIVNPCRLQKRRTLLIRPEDSKEVDSPKDSERRGLSKRRKVDSESSPETQEELSRNGNSLDLSWISSPRDTRRMRNELLEARNHITDLEHRIQQMHGVRKELEIMFDNENKAFKFQHDQDVKKIEQLETQIQTIRRRERDAKDQLEQALNDYRSMKLSYENKLEDLEFQINELQSQLEVYESEENEQVSVIQSDKEEISELLRKTEDERNYYKELSEELTTRITNLSKVSGDAEVKEQMLQTANLKIKSLEYTIESYGEWQIQSKIQQQKIIQFPELEKEVLKLREEVKNLRDEVQNKLILEEQVHDLNTRLEHYREQDKMLSSLQVAKAQLEQVVDEWQTMARAIVDIPCPNSSLPLKMKQVIDRLQQQEITLTSEKVQLDSQVKSMEQGNVKTADTMKTSLFSEKNIPFILMANKNKNTMDVEENIEVLQLKKSSYTKFNAVAKITLCSSWIKMTGCHLHQPNSFLDKLLNLKKTSFFDHILAIDMNFLKLVWFTYQYLVRKYPCIQKTVDRFPILVQFFEHYFHLQVF